MGKVIERFSNGVAGAISRSVDDIVISVKNAGETDIPFGVPVFLTSGGAVAFNPADPQDFDAFLGFAVRIADKTPDSYPQDQAGTPQAGSWKPGDVMEVLVRGGIVVPMSASGRQGGKVYIRKNDGALTADAGQSGTTVLLENVRIRNPQGFGGTVAEVIVNSRNLI